MYTAIVLRATEVLPHPNANKLKLVILGTYQVISTSIEVDELVVFFPTGGQLDSRFLTANSEYRKGEGINANPDKFGFFESNGRVRTIKLRGEVSDGYAVPLSSFDYLGPVTWVEGMMFTELNGQEVCRKYQTRATRERIAQNATQVPKIKTSLLPEHFDTKQVRDHVKSLPLGATIYFTEKLHGTSGRTGKLEVLRPNNFWNRIITYFLNLFGVKKKYVIQSGSRRVNFRPGTVYRDSYREVAELHFTKLKDNEVVYYEIVGWDKNEPLFSHHISRDTKDESLRAIAKRYDYDIEYTYGLPRGFTALYVYRITQNGVDLPWNELKVRCDELGVNSVPEVREPLVIKTSDDWRQVYEICKTESEGWSWLGGCPREGLCIRVGAPDITASNSILKFKSGTFCLLEGIRMNDDNYADPEDCA